jgi:hypothetical protein
LKLLRRKRKIERENPKLKSKHLQRGQMKTRERGRGMIFAERGGKCGFQTNI